MSRNHKLRCIAVFPTGRKGQSESDRGLEKLVFTKNAEARILAPPNSIEVRQKRSPFRCDGRLRSRAQTRRAFLNILQTFVGHGMRIKNTESPFLAVLAFLDRLNSPQDIGQGGRIVT